MLVADNNTDTVCGESVKNQLADRLEQVFFIGRREFLSRMKPPLRKWSSILQPERI